MFCSAYTQYVMMFCTIAVTFCGKKITRGKKMKQNCMLYLEDAVSLSLCSSLSLTGFKVNITLLQYFEPKQLNFKICLLTLVTSERANFAFILLRGLEFDGVIKQGEHSWETKKNRNVGGSHQKST